jgi:hypothetical protein
VYCTTEVINDDDKPNNQFVVHNFCSRTHCNLLIEEEKDEDNGKDEYNLNDGFIDNKAVEGKEEADKNGDGDALIDTP